jgi:hypothetical protein
VDLRELILYNDAQDSSDVVFIVEIDYGHTKGFQPVSHMAGLFSACTSLAEADGGDPR